MDNNELLLKQYCFNVALQRAKAEDSVEDITKVADELIKWFSPEPLQSEGQDMANPVECKN